MNFEQFYNIKSFCIPPYCEMFYKSLTAYVLEEINDIPYGSIIYLYERHQLLHDDLDVGCSFLHFLDLGSDNISIKYFIS